MTRYELLKANESLMRILHDNKIPSTEIIHLALYEKYLKLKESGHYKRYIMAVLSDETGMSIRAIYQVIHRYEKKITLP